MSVNVVKLERGQQGSSINFRYQKITLTDLGVPVWCGWHFVRHCADNLSGQALAFQKVTSGLFKVFPAVVLLQMAQNYPDLEF